MAETVFSNLRLRGTLAVVGITTLATAGITTATITTLGVTTATVGTANVQTLSGSTVRAKTFSGATLYRSGTQHQGALCRQTGGLIGACSTAVNESGDCVCGNP